MNSAHQLAAFLLEDEGAWDFTTKIDRNSISVSGAEDSWYLQSADATVSWHLDMDVRSWGLKEAVPIIRSVSVRLEFEVDNELDGGQNSEEVIELHYPSETAPAGPAGPDDVKAAALRYHSHVSAEIEIKQREEMYGGVQCVPVEIEVDLRTNNITVFYQA